MLPLLSSNAWLVGGGAAVTRQDHTGMAIFWVFFLTWVVSFALSLILNCDSDSVIAIRGLPWIIVGILLPQRGSPAVTCPPPFLVWSP